MGSAAAFPKIRLVPVFEGLSKPLAFIDDGQGRFFFLEQQGRIRVARGTTVDPMPFLDLTAKVYSRSTECGLLGMALHPDFQKNGRFFLNYTTKENGKLETVVSEWAAGKDGPGRERILLRFDQPWENHNGGSLVFGPDGMLYIGVGDGGAGGDPENNGQTLETWLGKILRIDVNSGAPYSVPADNPFVGRAGARPEIWAWGLRNPWRFSFDRQTGRLWCGDVGQNKLEEIDIIEKGKNYGWSAREGSHPFKPERAAGELVDPVIQYARSEGVSVTGGYVYRGSKCWGLAGVYIYADYGSGTIWGFQAGGESGVLLKSGLHISSFGEDAQGELYVCDHGRGRILRIALQ